MTDRASSGEEVYGLPIPRLAALSDRPEIEILTLAELAGLAGRPGDFSATIRERARFVTDACTRCNRCHAVCPVVVGNEYDAGLRFRKAIHTPLEQTLPSEYVIDIQSCLNTPPNYLPCQRCVDVCDDDAIHFDLPLERLHERRVGAVILAVGFELGDDGALAPLGYGAHPDVVTSAELDRLLEAPGPTGGFVAKPSNEEYPESVLIVLNEAPAFSAQVAASQLRRLADQDIGRISVLARAERGNGRALAPLRTAASGVGAELREGALQKVEPGANGRLVAIHSASPGGRLEQGEYDMVVLDSGVGPARGLRELAEAVGIELAGSGYVACSEVDGAGIATSRPGIYAAGCASGPKDVADSIREARAAAAGALLQLDPRRLRRKAPKPVASTTAGWDGLPRAEQQRRIENLLYALMKDG